MEKPGNNDEVIKGDLKLKYPATGKVITRRHAELVKTNDGKNDNNTTAKKGGSKNRKTMVEQPHGEYLDDQMLLCKLPSATTPAWFLLYFF